ncbi:aqualysin-1 [Paracoccidioides lutzii Pb01]|uniref:Aqualysin-1 n=2 Tax=Paracoccidioides TaxID=38946 RepID=C1H074_PARBA|nr:aqualysin-1 [Paracoccidioides lutzii Pb01]AAP83193.1 serine proteinase [Paracoccidioides brasiliensis]EEH33115.2 aqualysin-1 [Paracoccidioides lutzii Pb01]
MKGLFALIVPLLVTASPMVVDSIHKDAAPILSSVNAKEIPDSYIIVFKKHVTSASVAAHQSWVQDLHTTAMAKRSNLSKRNQFPIKNDMFSGLKHTYNISGLFLGYSGNFDEEVIEQIRRHPDVDYIEKDAEVHTMEDEEPVMQTDAPWGLARISHRELNFSTFNKYLYAADGGNGVDVYVIDTGTYIDHVDFENRAFWGATIPDGDGDEDGNGHGTHCSGTIAGKKYGVAKKSHIYAVKVLRSNGSGTIGDVIKGVEFVATSHTKNVEAAKAGKSNKKGFKGSVANMSLGGSRSHALDYTVNSAVETGVHFAVAAGNDNSNACYYSPAAAAQAVTVGASTLADERAFFSNYGMCLDVFGPGLNVMSTWIGGKYAVNTISGTSMASPHVAGLLAYFLSLQPSATSAFAVDVLTPESLKNNLVKIGTKGFLSDVPHGTANVLIWNGGGSSNYSDIIERSEYRPHTLKDEVNDVIDKFEKATTDELHAIYSEIKNAFIS